MQKPPIFLPAADMSLFYDKVKNKILKKKLAIRVF